MSRAPYASAVGSLMYDVVCTRPDLAYAVSTIVDLCQIQKSNIENQ